MIDGHALGAVPSRLPPLAVDADHLVQRLLEIFPGLLIWGTLVGLTVLAFTAPLAIAVFLILYDLYWVVRAFYTATHLIASYRHLRERRSIDWLERLRLSEDPAAAAPVVEARIRDLRQTLAARLQVPDSRLTRRSRRILRRRLRQENQFLHDLRTPAGTVPFSWREVLHVVILPTALEPLALLEQSLDAIAAADYPKDRLWVVVALEERAGPDAHAIRDALQARYARAFGAFLTTLHPDGIAGERKVKSANASWAGRRVQQLLEAAGIPAERVLCSNLDADTVVAPDYFGALTYTFLATPDRQRCSYQPLPLYHNNIWEAPAFARVISTNATFWQIIQAGRPERLETYSSHATPFRALLDVGFWDPTVVSEDSRIFWQAYVHYEGQYRVVPLYATVSMDATTAPTLLRSFVNQYKQMRRHAWGIENFPYLARAFAGQSAIPRRERVRRLFRMLESWHSWATASIILAALGWIPVLFGPPTFQQSIIAFNLPRITRTLLTIGTAGLFINLTLSITLLPPPPPGTPKRNYLWMTLQWLLVPFISWFLGSLPAIDAVTRLMLGKYLGFWVTPKVRVAPVVAPARQPVPLAQPQ